MALEEFWTSVWRATGFMIRHYSAVDSPRLEPARIEKYLRAKPYWLTPESVQGYDPADFDFLEPEQQEKLAQGVEEFLSVANRVRWDSPPSEDQLARAIEGFRKVVEVVRPDQYADFEAFVLGKEIERQIQPVRPDWVRELVFETKVDQNGYPALKIWAELEDPAFDEDVHPSNPDRVRDLLWETSRRVCPDRWPYVHFRAVSEQRPTRSAARR